MYYKNICILFISIISCQTLGSPENMVCVLTNAARGLPESYLGKYGTSGAQINCATNSNNQPLYLQQELITSAQSHSQDMAQNGCFDHNTCNCAGSGCTFDARIKQFLKLPSSFSLGENIAAGDSFNDPFQLTNAWLTSQGHCENIMKSDFDHLGISVVSSPNQQEKFQATQDFAGLGNKPNNPIVCAGHFGSGQNGMTLMAYVTGSNVAKVEAVVDNQRQEMAVDAGSSQKGVFKLSVNNLGASCHSYFVVALDANGQQIDRYPSSGASLANGIGSCTQSYDANAAGTVTTKQGPPPAPPKQQAAQAPKQPAAAANNAAAPQVKPKPPVSALPVPPPAKPVLPPAKPVLPPVTIKPPVTAPPVTAPQVIPPPVIAPADAQAVSGTPPPVDSPNAPVDATAASDALQPPPPADVTTTASSVPVDTCLEKQTQVVVQQTTDSAATTDTAVNLGTTSINDQSNDLPLTTKVLIGVGFACVTLIGSALLLILLRQRKTQQEEKTETV